MNILLSYYKQIIKYRSKLISRRLASVFLPKTSHKKLSSLPKVTLFISSLNTRYPLELTIKTLLKSTSYPNFQFIIADNNSTDGSLEYLESLKIENIPIALVKSDQPRLHSEWLDDIFQTVDTPYWFAVDSDLLFFCKDWIVDMVKIMEENPDLYLLNCERRVEGTFVEPVSGEKVQAGEAVSTWLFCVKTSLRNHLKESSFKFKNLGKDEISELTNIYDTGGFLLEKMRENRLKYGYMPSWFCLKYYHFGSLSWAFKNTSKDSNYLNFKNYQINHIKKMI